MSRCCFLPLLLVLPLLAPLPAPAAAAELKVERVADTVIDPRALYLPDGRWGHTTNGRTFQQDAIASFNGYQYATHFDADRKLCVARRKLDDAGDAAWQVVRFDDYRFQGGNDTHNAAVLGICPADGTIHLSFDHHGHPLRYRVSRSGVATRPAEAEWSAKIFGATTSELEPGRKIMRVTYPRFFATPDGALQFQCRIGGSGDGVAFLGDYRDGRWRDFLPIISGAGETPDGPSRNAYENGYTYDDDDDAASGKLHVTWCWRETPDPMSNHDLCYAFSDDRGVTWRNSAGDVVAARGASPITARSPGIAVWRIPQRRGLMNSTTQAVDGRGRIHVLTSHLPDEVQAQPTWEATHLLTRYFHYWRGADGQWHRVGMPFGGSRPQLCFDRDENAYLVFLADGGALCIASAAASAHWSDWRIVHREQERFTDQPVIDASRASRAARGRIVSVYIQQAPAQPTDVASALHALDYRLGP
jgi:hypothetical protein